MPNLFKIKIDDSKIFLTDALDACNVFNIKGNKAFSMIYKSPKKVLRIFNKKESLFSENIIIYHEDFNFLKESFLNSFVKIIAAGGLVINEYDEILFIFRNGKWDLPKGKLEENEQLDIAAVREVEEETGIKVKKIMLPLKITYHTYKNQIGTVLKENHWYLMLADKSNKFVPQELEGITKVAWVRIEDLQEILSNSYSSIQMVITKYLKYINKKNKKTETDFHSEDET